MSKKYFLVTTNPGIEDIVIQEVKEKIGAKAKKFFGLRGRVLIEVSESKQKEILKLRSIYHVIKYVDKFEINKSNKGLQDIYTKIKSIEIEELKNSQSFRVTAERFGNHEFTSIDIQKYAGKAIVEKYGKKVDLKNYETEVICDVIGKWCFVGIKLTRESLHKTRYRKVFEHPAGIKPPLAYAMIRLSGLRESEILLDPFCGGGTIPIEAAQTFGEKIKILASDINPKYIEGAKLNAKEAGVIDLIEFKVADARELEKYFPEYRGKVNRIVTNPPYGIRMKKRGLKDLYKKFLLSSREVINDEGKLVLITTKAVSFRSLVENIQNYVVVEERVVGTGGLYPHIFVLKPL